MGERSHRPGSGKSDDFPEFHDGDRGEREQGDDQPFGAEGVLDFKQMLKRGDEDHGDLQQG